MKLTIDQAVFAETVNTAARHLPPRPPWPVLAGLKLQAIKRKTAGTLRISAFDYEVGAVTATAADVGDGGTVLVSGRLLADITKQLPAGQDVHLSADGTRVVLECGSARFTLAMLPVQEYPALPELPPAAGTVDAGLFAEAVGQAAAAACIDESLPTLTGVQIEAGPGELRVLATDRYRIVDRRLEWGPQTDVDPARDRMLLPARRLKEAAKAAAGVVDDGEQLLLHLPGGDDGLAGLSCGRLTVSSRMIDGELPDFGKMTAKHGDPTIRVRVVTEALVEAVRRVAQVATRNAPLLLDIADDRLTLTAGTSDDAMGLDVVDCALEGEPVKVAFNPGFLADGLGMLGTDEAQLNLISPVKPALWHGATGADHDPPLKYWLMPIRTADTAD